MSKLYLSYFCFFFFKKGAIPAWEGERNGVISGHLSVLYIPVPLLLMLILPLTVRFCQNIIDTLCERFSVPREICLTGGLDVWIQRVWPGLAYRLNVKMYASLVTYGKVASKLFVECTFCPESVFVLPWDGNERGYISVKLSTISRWRHRKKRNLHFVTFCDGEKPGQGRRGNQCIFGYLIFVLIQSNLYLRVTHGQWLSDHLIQVDRLIQVS